MRQYTSSESRAVNNINSVNKIKRFFKYPDGYLITKGDHELIVFPSWVKNRYGIDIHALVQYIECYYGEPLIKRIIAGKASDADYIKVTQCLLVSNIIFRDTCREKVEW
jgi:hypothetical protein